MRNTAITRTGQFNLIGGSAADRLRERWLKGVEARKNGYQNTTTKPAKKAKKAREKTTTAPKDTPEPSQAQTPTTKAAFVLKASQIEAHRSEPKKAKIIDLVTPSAKAATAEAATAEILKLKTERAKIASDYDEKRDAARVEQINKRLKDLYFMRSKLAPVPQMPKLKKVILSGFKSGEFIGTDAQILNHLKNIRTCQKQAEKEGLPCEGLRVQIVPA